MKSSSARRLSICALLVFGHGIARADEPKFDFGKKEEVKDVVWKASGQVGAYGSTGNAQTATVNGAVNVSRTDGTNKVTFDAVGAYSQVWARNGTVTVPAAGATVTQGELDAANARTAGNAAAANWLAKLRYDRFFTERNSGYVTAFGGQDYVVSKDVIAGGQIGYSRLVMKSEMQELATEIGYDINYTHYQPSAKSDAVLIHAARLFVGYLLTLRKDTAINASVEALINGNPVDVGPAGDPNTHKGFGEASRVIGKLGLTTALYKKVSFKFGITLKYDNAPSPVSVTVKDATGMTVMADFSKVGVLRNEKLDFIGEAAIVVSFL